MDMKLAKLTITPLSPSKLVPFEVLFNPNTYSIVKSVTWNQQADSSPTGSGGKAKVTNRELDAPPLVFGGGGTRTLTLQLFFDVTEGGADAQTTDVRSETNKIVALTLIERKQGKPPVCKVSWGSPAPQNMDFPFVGVVTSLTQNFVLFRASGEPVRANLTVVFTEFNDPVANKKKTDPDLTTHLVKRGDTLSAIAAELYRDPTLWRTIAAANELDDPRHLQIGARLAIPKLT